MLEKWLGILRSFFLEPDPDDSDEPVPSLAEIIAEKGGDVVAGLSVPFGHTISLSEHGELIGFEAYNNYHRIDNAALKQLATVVSLEVLDLQCADAITDRGLSYLIKLPRLRKLRLGSERITNAGMVHLAKLPSLVDLSLLGIKLTQRGLAEIAKIDRLRALTVWMAEIGNGGLKPIAKMRNLQVLHLGGNDLTDAGLSSLAPLVALEDVNLAYHPEITARGMEVLKAWPLIKRLNLARTQLGDDGLKLMGHCPLLESLEISKAAITDTGVAHLQNCTKLKDVSLNENQITDRGLIHLSQLNNLESLELDETSITDDGLEALIGLPELKKLSVCETNVTGRILKKSNFLDRLDEFNHSGLPDVRLDANYVRHDGLDYEVDQAESEMTAYLHYEADRPLWMLDVKCTDRLTPRYRSSPIISGPGFEIDAATWRDLAPGEAEVTFDEAKYHPILPDNPCNFCDGEHSFPNAHRIRLLHRNGRRFTVAWTFEIRSYLEEDPRSVEVLADVEFKRVEVWADDPIDSEMAQSALKRYFDSRNFASPEPKRDGRRYTFQFWPNVT